MFTQIANFGGATFTQWANFYGATFTQHVSFFEATFSQNAYFSKATFSQNAYFIGARFSQNADFSGATFSQNADFSGATFSQNADFSGATFSQNVSFARAVVHAVLDLQHVSVAQDGEVLLHRVNRMPSAKEQSSQQQNSPPPGLKLRLRGTLVDRFRFEDVHWHQQRGRLVLQDELDLEKEYEGATHEVVADAYRRLVNNFERARQYELAEQAVVGEMEMRRKNPETPWLTRRFLGMYKLLSHYGSSFGRALFCLAVLVLLFAVAFPALGLRARDPAAGTCSEQVIRWELWGWHTGKWRYLRTFEAGLVAALETVTLQREPAYRPANNCARIVAVAELIVIPGQLTLFLLALRRRFRR